ncbi:MAG: hypothetical protein AAGF85_00550 [Bacteroidota bacterium]
METIKIEIPRGYEVESFDRNSGELKLKEKPKPVTERIKTIDDVLADQDLSTTDLDEWKNVLTEDEVAYRLLKLLAKSLNEGWEPDWDDRSQYKYYPWFEMGGSSGFRFFDYDFWLSCSGVGSRLCFKSRKLAEHAATAFQDLYKDYMLIND